jgi:hypothetical protein
MDDPNQGKSFKDRLIDHIKRKQRHAQSIVRWLELGGKVAWRRATEKKIVEAWIEAMFRGNSPYDLVEPCSARIPDCELTDKDGKKTGVEVTELVDENMIRLSKRKRPRERRVIHGRTYTRDQFLAKVIERLETKECKLKSEAKSIRERYVKMILIIHTGEPELMPDSCRAWIKDQTFPKLQLIDEAFLLMRKPRARDTLATPEANFHQVITIGLG